MVPKTPNNLKIKTANTIQPGYRFLVIAFTILALILISAILYFALSQATIYLTPNFNTQKIGFAMQITDQSQTGNPATSTDRLPGKLLETSAEETKTYPADQFSADDNLAGGQVTIINNYSKNQTLVATTRLLNEVGKLYRLDNTVVVPADGKITTTATADKPGQEFVSGKSKLMIPGLWEGLQDKIYGETEGFAIGKSTKFQITQNTLNAAKENLKQILLDKALENFKTQMPEATLDKNNLVVEEIKYSTDAKIGSSQKEFSLTLGLGIKALVFDLEKMRQLALDNLPDAYKLNNPLVSVIPDSFTYIASILDKNSENLIGQIKGEYSIKIANLQIKPSELAGLTKAEALKYLNSFSDIKNVKIMLPFWSRYLPALEDKIKIQITQ